MEAFKQAAMGIAGLAGSAIAAAMLNGGEGPYGAASKFFTARGGDVVKEHPLLASIMESENRASVEALSAAKSREEKVNLAVQVFLGFWMINGDARAELCRQNGVDLSYFVEKFERRNARQHEKALAYLEEAGLKEDRLYKSRRGDMMEKLRLRMLHMDGSMRALSTEDACQIIQVDADKYLAKLDFRILDPALNQVLMGS